MLRPTLLSLSLTLVTLPVSSADDLSDLMSMSLEELSMLDVTMKTASKFSQKLSDIPASVYVLDGERILRSGAQTIPEALALVPGLNVTKFNETEFFVSARGFHDGLYNKMLVMLDGRSLSSPMYGGVYWTDIDYVLADIDRIEVLRGPGGAIWGGNAVNGVINIITKSTEQTQGSYVQATSASFGEYNASLRHGFNLANGSTGRVFIKSREAKSYPSEQHYVRKNETVGLVLEKGSQTEHWTFRAGAEQDKFDMPLTHYQFSGGSYSSQNQSIEEIESHSVYAQLEYTRSSDRLQSRYMIWAQQNLDEALDAPGRYRTLDLDGSFTLKIDSQHNLLFGGGYRLADIDFTHTYNNTDINDIPAYVRIARTDNETDSILNGFVQLESQWSERFSTVAGAKVEYFEHTYTLASSPQLRATYQLDGTNSVWAGVAKAHVSPSYMETHTDYYSVYYDGDYYISASYSDPNMALETVESAELGYRYMGDQTEIDLVAFVKHHDNARNSDFIKLDQQFDIYVVNDRYEANSHGLELGASMYVSPKWRLFGSYTFLTLDQKLSQSPVSEFYQENYYDVEQQHMASVQSLWTINSQWQLDLVLKGQIIEYAAEYEDPQSSNYSHVPNVLAMDARVGWQKSKKWPKIELMIQNIGEKDGYVRDYSQYNSGYQAEQRIHARLSHEF